jgi:serine/threonine-protein kinase RsbW
VVDRPGRLRVVAPTRTLQLPEARVEDLRAIREFVLREARSLGADEAVADDLVQAVDESATNIIRHGYRGLPGRLEVAVGRDGPDLVIAMRDDAPPFDPTRYTVGALDRPLAARRPGGFGIHLTRSCVDRVSHTRRDPAGNELTLVRHLDPPTEERTP